MSGTTKKPSSPQSGRKTPATADSQASPGSTRNATHSPNSSSNATANGLGRSPSGRQSPVSARAAARRPGAGRSNLSMSSVPGNRPENQDDDTRAEAASVINDLKEQVQKAETVSEQYRKQLGVLQMRLDDAVSEQTKSEDQAHEKDRVIASQQEEVRQLSRRLREMEQAHETELASVLKDKENLVNKEEDLQAVIQRLKETIAQKDPRMNVDSERNLSRSSSFRNRSTDGESEQFAPSSQLQRSPSRNNSKLILQKDKLIESLRLELAETQIKLVEMENKGGDRTQDLEKELLDARMANARLMEDNESYQLLLSEKTLNGDFTKADVMNGPGPDVQDSGMGSLADELESAGVGEEGESRRKLENEVKNLKDQNKALALYIERIIGRLLQHEGFEDILDKNSSGVPTAKAVNKDKDLPPPPPEKPSNTGQSFLQRARSVVSGQNMRPQSQQLHSDQQKPLPKPRPVSQLIQPSTSESQPSTNEDPTTAPRIPIGRSRTVHRRVRSDQVEGPDPAAAAVVGQMYRGSPSRSPSAGPLSPGLGPTLPEQGPVMSGSNDSAVPKRASVAARSSSAQSHDRVVSSSGSVTSDRSGEVMSTAGTSSPPRSSPGMNNYTGAVMTQNKLRPLRLVRENQEENEPHESERTVDDDEIARKKANRASWLPWFNQPKKPESPNP